MAISNGSVYFKWVCVIEIGTVNFKWVPKHFKWVHDYNYMHLCHSGLRGCRGQNSFDDEGYTSKAHCSMLELIFIKTSH